MKNNNYAQMKGVIDFEDVKIHIFETGDRSVTTRRIFYEDSSEPFDLEYEMEIDRQKYEAMKWYNKTFCSESNK